MSMLCGDFDEVAFLILNDKSGTLQKKFIVHQGDRLFQNRFKRYIISLELAS